MTRNIIALSQLRPTQITVGMLEVKHKRKRIKELVKRPAELIEYILMHPVRVVLGPAEKAYVIDHHHLALALLKEEYETAPMDIEADLSTSSFKTFWKEMEKLKLVHPYDAEGKRRPLKHIPASLKKLEDDPYRSLAGFVREAGGFIKVPSPFAEFLWADYFRERIKRKLLDAAFEKAVKKACAMAHLAVANNLPGFVKTPLKR